MTATTFSRFKTAFLSKGAILLVLGILMSVLAAPVAAQTGSYALLLSSSPTRSNPVPLAGASVAGDIYVFVNPGTGIDEVRFFIDDPNRSGSPVMIEGKGPWDLGGTTRTDEAKPFDSEDLAVGSHELTASILLLNGTTQVISATFQVASRSVVFGRDAVSFSVEQGQTTTDPKVETLTASDGLPANFTIAESLSWLTVTPASGATPANLTLSVNAAGLATGVYRGTVTANATGYKPDTLDVSMTVGGSGGCFPLPCGDIFVDSPYLLNFEENHGMIEDSRGFGTGFTYVDPPSLGQGYLRDKLTVDSSAGTLVVNTTAGLASQAVNSQDNALAVGVDGPSQINVISTTLLNVPRGTGKNEQAGIWFGNDEDNQDKIIVMSTDTGLKLQHQLEVGGVLKGTKSTSIDLGNSTLGLKLKADPADRSITAYYRVDGGGEINLGKFTAPGEFFSFDGARIDPAIGTDTFAGILASHRKANTPLAYTFDEFLAEKSAAGVPPPGDGLDFKFIRSSFGVRNPSSMAWGPDNKLYVSEVMGKIHRITLNAAKQVVSDQVFSTLGTRLTLGITIDPASTPSNVILYASHSSPSFNNGEPNSSMVTKLWGSNLENSQHVITGLPRAIANHAINSIHFGPDGRLFISQGGNTGAGAPNLDDSEFGTMQEQPLSAALLVADVKNPTFDGSCNNPTNIFGPPPCDVTTYATGLRNAYDHVWHSNGSLYTADNGLGVVGTFPPSPTSPCFGFVDTKSWTQGGHSPGAQPDLLFRVEEDKFYGHPNPYRNECVYRDGSYQGVPTPSNYQGPMFNFGNHKSTNGLIEYTSDAFGGQLRGNLLAANYSQGDDIMRLKLSADGRSVVSSASLIGGFRDPLPLVQSPDGTIFVGEFPTDTVTALIPDGMGTGGPGTWSNAAPLPTALLDAGGTAIGDKLYVVGGKTASGAQSTMYIYNSVSNSWTTGPNLPGVAIENPATVAHNGKLYVFGGSTGPSGGAVANAAVYNPATGAWSTLPSMPQPRGGGTAQVLGGLIYVAGGMDVAGASQPNLQIFNPVSNAWSTGPSMSTPRDNPGSAALGGRLYVFGGRFRGTDGTLETVEMFDPATNSWTGRAPMPTGRRTVVVGTLGGRAQVMGGEETPTNGTYAANEEYDPLTNSWRSLEAMPTPRHGAVGGTINGLVYVVGGGPTGGASFSAVNEAFSLGG